MRVHGVSPTNNGMDTSNRVADTMYSLRSHVAARWTIWSRVLVFTGIAVALSLLVEGYLVGGLVILVVSIPSSWLSGLWVIPWSTDTYLRNLALIMRNARNDIWYAGYQRSEQLGILRAEVMDLTPPQRYIDIHEHMLIIIGQLRDIIDDEKGDFTDRAVTIFDRCRLLFDIRIGLENESDSYSRLIRQALDKYRLIITSGMNESEDSLRRNTSRIKKLRPPGKWITWHKGYVLALTDYTAAVCSYYLAVRENDIEAVKRVVKKVSVTHTILEAERQRYLEKFRGEK
jgi:hypothetical protein